MTAIDRFLNQLKVRGLEIRWDGLTPRISGPKAKHPDRYFRVFGIRRMTYREKTTMITCFNSAMGFKPWRL